MHFIPYGCPKNIFHSFFKILWVLLSIMVIAGSIFACILIWYFRNRIKGQISNISVQEDKGTSDGYDFSTSATIDWQSPNSTHKDLKPKWFNKI